MSEGAWPWGRGESLGHQQGEPAVHHWVALGAGVTQGVSVEVVTWAVAKGVPDHGVGMARWHWGSP